MGRGIYTHWVELITAESEASRFVRYRRIIRFPQLTMPLIAAYTPGNWRVTHTDEIVQRVRFDRLLPWWASPPTPPPPLTPTGWPGDTATWGSRWSSEVPTQPSCRRRWVITRMRSSSAREYGTLPAAGCRGAHPDQGLVEVRRQEARGLSAGPDVPGGAADGDGVGGPGVPFSGLDSGADAAVEDRALVEHHPERRIPPGSQEPRRVGRDPAAAAEGRLSTCPA